MKHTQSLSATPPPLPSFQFVRSAFNAFVSSGTGSEDGHIARFRIRSFNLEVLSGSSISLLYLIASAFGTDSSQWAFVWPVLIYGVSCMGAYVLNHYYYYRAAVFLYCCSMMFGVTFLSLCFGLESNTHIILLVAGVSPFLLMYDRMRDAAALFTICGLIFMGLLFLELPPMLGDAISPAKLTFIRRLNTVFLFIGFTYKLFRTLSLFLQSLKRLEQEEAQLNAVLDSSVDMIWSIDRELRVVTANANIRDNLKRFYGIGIVPGENIFLHSPKSAPQWQPLYERAFAGETFSIRDVWVDPSTGAVHHFMNHFSPVRDRSGQITGSTVSMRNISDTVLAESQRDESERKYRLIADNALDTIALHNPIGGAFRYVSPSVKALTGYEAEELLGTSPYDLIHNADVTPARDAVLSTSADSVPRPVVFRFLKKDGVYVWIESIIHPVYSQEGKLEYLQTTSRDISDKKQAEAALEQKMQELNEKNEQLQRYIESNLQLENFAYLASHDLREPMRTIVRFSQMLQQRLKERLQENERDYLDFIIKATRHLDRMISDLLDFSRVNQSAIEPQAFSPVQIIQEVKRALWKVIEESRAEVDAEELPARIEADPVKFQQLIQNLVANGIKYHQDGVPPAVKIGGEPVKGGWRF
ncbi:MAG: PAS domain S-box protein, partial [Bacteroidetes bacterium]